MGAMLASLRRMPFFRKLFIALLGAGAVGFCWWLSARDAGEKGATALPADPSRQSVAQLLGGLILLSPDQVVTAPEVDGFQWPCGAPTGAMIYDAQPFGAMNRKRHGHHTGKDLNGIGGQNTDLGEPVCAAGRGLVVYSGVPSDEWGNVVVLAHRIPGEQGIVQTLYAHLNTREARVGQFVSRGQRIGTIGTANGKYLAHLHFEAIRSLSTEAGMRGYHPTGTMNRTDPAELIRGYPAPPMPDPYSEVRRIRIREALMQDTTAAPTPIPGAKEGFIPVKPQQFLTP